jgi:hypothetical protein
LRSETLGSSDNKYLLKYLVKLVILQTKAEKAKYENEREPRVSRHVTFNRCCKRTASHVYRAKMRLAGLMLRARGAIRV